MPNRKMEIALLQLRVAEELLRLSRIQIDAATLALDEGPRRSRCVELSARLSEDINTAHRCAFTVEVDLHADSVTA